jgi:hypothetical protein
MGFDAEAESVGRKARRQQGIKVAVHGDVAMKRVGERIIR